jgi:hypothetical protein
MGKWLLGSVVGVILAFSVLDKYPATEEFAPIVGIPSFLIGVFCFIRIVLRAVFGTVAWAGGAIVYHGARAVIGTDAAKEYESGLRAIGGAAGVIGGAVLAGEVVDIGGGEGAAIASADGLDPEAVACAQGVPIDLDGDGILDGFDTDGDGVLDTNVAGVPVNGLEGVSEYTRADGTKVDSYLRTHADGTTANNLRPNA